MTKKLTKKERKKMKQLRRRTRLQKRKKTEELNKNMAYILSSMNELNFKEKDKNENICFPLKYKL
jgi:hypothetical protein